MKKIRIILAIAVLLVLAAIAAGCGGSNADTVNKNLGKKCEQFECQRHIIAINGITDEVLLDVEGRCSIEKNGALSSGTGGGTLELICKYGPDDYRKSFVGLSDNVTWTSVQENALKVDEYRTKFIFRPKAIIPDFDLATSP